MKNLLNYIVTNIVDKPSEVTITETVDEQSGIIQLLLAVSPEDMGRVIGKRGKIIQAIRNLLAVKAALNNKKVILSLKEV